MKHRKSENRKQQQKQQPTTDKQQPTTVTVLMLICRVEIHPNSSKSPKFGCNPPNLSSSSPYSVKKPLKSFDVVPVCWVRKVTFV